MQRARAFVFAAEEDFGIVPLEAQACGTPVIAYGKGGSLETVRGLVKQGPGEKGPDSDAPTGVYFEAQTVPSLQAAVGRFEKTTFDPDDLRAHAETFSAPRFRDEFSRFVGERYRVFEEFRR